MISDLDYYGKHPSICMHEKCIDCPLLPMCEKDENEYDPEKVKKHIEDNFCPKCGSVVFETTDGRGVCIICFLEDE